MITDSWSIDDVRQNVYLTAAPFQELISSPTDRLYTPNRLVSLLPPVLIPTSAQKVTTDTPWRSCRSPFVRRASSSSTLWYPSLSSLISAYLLKV